MKYDDRPYLSIYYLTVWLVGILVFSAGCGVYLGMFAGKYDQFGTRESLTLETPRPDLIDVAAEVGKSLGYTVQEVSKPSGLLQLGRSSNVAVSQLVGTGEALTSILTVHVMGDRKSFDLEYAVAGQIVGGTAQERATKALEEYKRVLAERIGQQFSQSMTASSSQLTPDARQCAVNYKVEGNPGSGQTFKTFEERPNIGVEVVFNRTAAAVAREGYEIQTVNKDAGLIAAAAPVKGSSRKVSLNAIVATRQDRVRVELTFALAPGMSTPSAAVREEFCKLLQSAFSET